MLARAAPDEAGVELRCGRRGREPACGCWTLRNACQLKPSGQAALAAEACRNPRRLSTSTRPPSPDLTHRCAASLRALRTPPTYVCRLLARARGALRCRGGHALRCGCAAPADVAQRRAGATRACHSARAAPAAAQLRAPTGARFAPAVVADKRLARSYRSSRADAHTPTLVRLCAVPLAQLPARRVVA